MLNFMVILGGLLAIVFVIAMEMGMKCRKEGNPKKAVWDKVMYSSGVVSLFLIYIAAFLLQ